MVLSLCSFSLFLSALLFRRRKADCLASVTAKVWMSRADHCASTQCCPAATGRRSQPFVRSHTRSERTAAARKSNDARIDLMRSRPNYSAIKGGIIRPNPLALILKAGKNGGHERDSIASTNGRQTETARSARKSFAHAPRVTYS